MPHSVCALSGKNRLVLCFVLQTCFVLCRTSSHVHTPVGSISPASIGGPRIDLQSLFEGEREFGGPGALPAWFSECLSKAKELEDMAVQIRRDTPRDVGIGIRLAKKLTVLSLHPEGAAARSGLIHDNDTVKAVDGQEVHGLTNREVAQLISGPENTAVELLLLRDGEEIAAKIMRVQKPLPTGQSQEKNDDSDLDLTQPPSFEEASSTTPDQSYGFGFSLTESLAVSNLEDGASAQISPGDVLLSIDGIRVTGVPARDVQLLLSGRCNSLAELLFLRPRNPQHPDVVHLRLRRDVPAGAVSARQEAGGGAVEPAAEVASEVKGKSLKKKIGGFLSGFFK